MRRVFTACAIAVAALTFAAPASAKGPKIGVFGKINGQRLKAVPKKRAPGLVQSDYSVDPALGTAVFTLAATEVPKRRGKTQVIIISCLSPTSTPPWTADCIASYGESQFKKRTYLENIWLASAEIVGTLQTVGPFHVTVESFDGATVRGRFSGTLDSNQSCNQGACVETTSLGTISAEGTFTVPDSF